MASLRERMKRLEHQNEGGGLNLIVSTEEPGEPKYYKSVKGETVEISEGEYNRLAKSARPVEIAFKFAEELEAP